MTRLDAGLLAVAAIAAFAGWGCGGGRGVATPTLPAGSAAFEATQLHSPDPRGPLANLSDFQRDLLSDGVLTLAEYEHGILKLKECMAALGYTATKEWMPTKNHGHSARWFNPGPGRETTEAEKRQSSERSAKCFRDYTDALGYIWSQSHGPSAEEKQSAREAFAACVNERGAGELPKHPSEEEVWGFITSAKGAPDVRACRDKIEQEFDMPAFPG